MLLAWVLVTGAAIAQEAPPQATAQAGANEAAQALAARALQAFAGGDLAQAESLLREQLALQPTNFVAYYNLACVRAAAGDKPGACGLLAQSIEHGFSDLRQLRRDPSLAPIRGERRFQELVSGWPSVLQARRDANLESARSLFRKDYSTALDEPLRLAFLSAFDAKAFEAARAEVSKLGTWADQHVILGLSDADELAQDAWVVVVLPRHEDFMRWVRSVYGAAAVQTTSLIAGSYEHDGKRLVAMDLGSTLRHEFFHVLHWRSCTRLGQLHPIWIQEGLCSLVEDYDTGGDGSLQPAPSWRTNTAKRLEKLGHLLPIEQLAALPPNRFSGSRPLANYAQARAVFLFIWQRGKLADWYSTYTRGFHEDPSGVKALEGVFEMPIEQLNAQYKAWLRMLPAVPEEILPGMASLGVEIDAGRGEGPVVFKVFGRKKDGLRTGDIVTSIDSKATRDIAELVRVLSQYQPGDTVEVAYRRGRLYGSANVTLVER